MKLRFVLVAAVVAMTGCSNDDDASLSNERKDIDLNESESLIVASSNIRAFEMLDFYNQNATEDNFIISPLSAQFALGMLANGAEGNTLDELNNALGVSSLNEFNSLNNRLLKQLPQVDKKSCFKAANSLWLQEGFDVLPSYYSTVSSHYQAEAATLDLTSIDGINEINKWCSSKTDGVIPQIVTEPYNDGISLVLLNALYFKGEWSKPFDSSKTIEGDFYNADGTKSSVDKMCDKKIVDYYENEKLKMIRLNYGNSAYRMSFILPNENFTLSEALADIDKTEWDSWSKSGQNLTKCDLQLPKFKIEFFTEIDSYLKSLGVNDIYDSQKADFSSLSMTPVCVSGVCQKSVIEIDESGTVTASATIIGNSWADLYENSEFSADRPFAFVIDEQSTGAILFVGAVNKL